MKQILTVALIPIVVMFDFAESNPSTLCMYRTCTNTGMSCNAGAILQIRNRYNGELQVERWRDLFTEKCSPDGVFCVQTIKNSGDLYLRYANVRTYIPENARHPEVRGTWCTEKSGVEYWMDL